MKKNDIKNSLLKQLEKNGASVPHFVDLVDDYADLWDCAKKLKADIRKKGINYIAISASGNEYEKENPSIKSLVNVSKQKLTILEKLKLSTDNVIDEDNEDFKL